MSVLPSKINVRRAVEERLSPLPLCGGGLLGWRRRGLLLVLGGGVEELQRLPHLPVLLVDQLQGQRAVQRLGG